ncbi:hypothetical protein V6N13_097266 [Hibiscus sabdariffa]
MFSAKNAFDVILWKKHEGDQTVLQPWQSMVSGFLAGTAGLAALWKGLLPRLMRIPPGQAIMWVVADQMMGLYEKKIPS